MNELVNKVATVGVPKTLKEFLRAAVYLFGALCLELFTGAVSALGFPVKTTLSPGMALLGFVGFLVPYGYLESQERARHLREQSALVERNSSPPPAEVP